VGNAFDDTEVEEGRKFVAIGRPVGGFISGEALGVHGTHIRVFIFLLPSVDGLITHARSSSHSVSSFLVLREILKWVQTKPLNSSEK
jgi:hypothetical protein